MLPLFAPIDQMSHSSIDCTRTVVPAPWDRLHVAFAYACKVNRKGARVTDGTRFPVVSFGFYSCIR